MNEPAAPSAPPPPAVAAEPVPLRPRTLGRRLVRFALIATALGTLIFAIAAGTALTVYYQMAGSYDLSKVGQVPSRSEVFDADGTLHGRIDNVNREVVPLSAVSPWFLKAVVAREDERFYQHHGVDYPAIARAMVRDVSRSRRREGASTITQQLARNALPLGRERTLHRKLLEAMVAARIEKRYSKDQILEAYVNRIYLGAGVYGVETAARRYFGKAARELDLSESALLAGIVRSPNTNSPLRNAAGARTERDSVLDRLQLLGQAPPAEVAAAKAEEVRVQPKAGQATVLAGRDYGMDAVRAQLDELLGSDDLELGGLRIYTTLDPRLQRAAERAVNTRLEKVEETSGYNHETRAAWLAAHPASNRNEETATDYLQGALVAVDNKTGAIRALVGGRSYEESSYNRALARPGRQVGSTFKPFVYAAAFERGMLPTTPVEDSPIRPGELVPASNRWSPGNSDGRFLGTVSADVGLIQSRNIMAIRVGEWAGRDNVHRLAQRAGLLDEKTPAQPSLHLGAFEATPRALAGAYTAFPNKGVARTPFLIERIDNADGETLYRTPGAVSGSGNEGAATVMSAESAQLTSDLMERVLTEGTGKSAASLGLRVPAAGKTGTTNDFKDAWFAGYTTSLTCAVWVGFDRPQTISARGYGAALALPIWVDFMQAAASLSGPGAATKRYPALALHGAAGPGRAFAPTPTPPAVAANDNSASAASVAPLANATPTAPPPLEPNSEQQQTPPSSDEPGARYIVDARTGRIIGLDGTEAAAREAQLRQQEAARQQALAQQQRQQQLALQQQQQQQQQQAAAATNNNNNGSVPPEPTVV
ncbi:MAG: PBP1A family penicillin-binding protein, partial [Verrucomicrobia bacterium]|nr:PBP1A family penicillin-binding protein [Verrucomicrobiota bacterium]